LFGQGEPLEKAVNLAFDILGVKSNNYNFKKKDLEIDCLANLGKIILLGECEGKDNKDIDKTKLSQLLTNRIEYYAEPDVNPAKPIKSVLFGNPIRLKKPSDRNLDFTKACIDISENNSVALVKTVDLFNVVAYVKNSKDKIFARACIDKIINTTHGIVVFPKIPKK
jgi:hypothetical protein